MYRAVKVFYESGLMIRIRLNFNNAVRHIRASYGTRTNGMTFVDLALPQGRALVHAWAEKCSPEYKDHEREDVSFRTKIDQFLATQPVFALRDPVRRRMLVAGRSVYGPPLFDPDVPFDPLVSLYHETGHMIVPGGHAPWQENMSRKEPEAVRDAQDLYAENVADSFAAASGLRLRFLSVAGVRRLSLRRAVDAWTLGNFSHATSRALDTLADLEEKSGLAATLTPEETRDFSALHAKRRKPAATALSDTRRFFRERAVAHALKDGPQEETGYFRRQWLEALAATCRDEPPLSLHGYAAARILSEVVRTGRLEYPVPRAFDVAPAFRDRARELLAEHARQTAVRGLIGT